MNIEWKIIEGYENYEVSNFGHVRRNGKILSPGVNKKHLQVGLSKNGKIVHRFVHRLVAEAFIPNPQNLPQINHKDENPANNFVWVNPDGSVDPERSNLEWCDCRYNINYGTRTERMIRTKYKPVNQYTLDGVLVKRWPSIKSIETTLGIDRGQISRVCRGVMQKTHGFTWRFAS